MDDYILDDIDKLTFIYPSYPSLKLRYDTLNEVRELQAEFSAISIEKWTAFFNSILHEGIVTFRENHERCKTCTHDKCDCGFM